MPSEPVRGRKSPLSQGPRGPSGRRIRSNRAAKHDQPRRSATQLERHTSAQRIKAHPCHGSLFEGLIAPGAKASRTLQARRRHSNRVVKCSRPAASAAHLENRNSALPTQRPAMSCDLIRGLICTEKPGLNVFIEGPGISSNHVPKHSAPAGRAKWLESRSPKLRDRARS